MTSAILFTGEAGCDLDRLARAIHSVSLRRSLPLVHLAELPVERSTQLDILRRAARSTLVIDLYAIEKKSSEDLALAPNDIIDVPTSAGKSFLRSLIQGVGPSVGQLPVRVVP